MKRGPKPSIEASTDGAKEVSKAMPSCLQGEERKHWRKLMDFLGDRPLHQLTHDACIRYCQYQEVYNQCLEDVQKRGIVYQAKNGCLTKNPSATMLCTVGDRLRRLAHDLGMVEEGAGRHPGYTAEEIAEARRFESCME